MRPVLAAVTMMVLRLFLLEKSDPALGIVASRRRRELGR